VRRSRILILRTTSAPVARNDEECLRGLYDDVIVFRVRQSPKWALLWNAVHMAVWLLYYIWRADGVFFRFADYHALLPTVFARVFRRKVWIVLGGYDAHWFPEYCYGVYHTRLRRWCVQFAIRNATAVLPVDKSLYDGENTYSFPVPRATGIIRRFRQHLLVRGRCGAEGTGCAEHRICAAGHGYREQNADG